MRLPRLRFTIGRLMVVVLLAGLVFWAEILPRLRSPVAEYQTQASYEQAVLTREVAEYALKEYTEGIFQQDLATAQGGIALAKADLEQSRDRLAQSAAREPKGLAPDPANTADRLAVEQARVDLGKAQTQLDVLMKDTSDKQIKSLQADIAKAQADEEVKRRAYLGERARRRGVFGF